MGQCGGDQPTKVCSASHLPIAGREAFPDNNPVTSGEMKSRSTAQQLELWLISLGMSVLAYVLEKMIIRSVKNGGTKP